ncbi:DUF732 domain-containing protein [Frankia sp. EI5c]|uniref:DUF732 domain-containing protein n=1 Tax=Frankia sp. EI5c TaxID=683316 RepID=UPI000FF8A734|nr:DUF732 domain-containing protein [Frankia sp. EI5c]
MVQALTGDAGIPASWAGDVQAALGRGCTPGQIADAYRAPITGAVRNPTAIRRARIRDLTPEPARPAAPSAHVPPNVRSMCRRHGLPGPCPVCADLEAGRADDVEVVVLVGLAVLLSQDDPPAAEQPAPTLTPTASATVVPDYADPAPSADNPSRFIREARMIGFQSESDLIAAGRAVCAGVASGTQSSAFAEAAAWLDALSLSADQRTVLIAMSAENLCPQYRS